MKVDVIEDLADILLPKFFSVCLSLSKFVDLRPTISKSQQKQGNVKSFTIKLRRRTVAVCLNLFDVTFLVDVSTDAKNLATKFSHYYTTADKLKNSKIWRWNWSSGTLTIWLNVDDRTSLVGMLTHAKTYPSFSGYAVTAKRGDSQSLTLKFEVKDIYDSSWKLVGELTLSRCGYR